MIRLFLLKDKVTVLAEVVNTLDNGDFEVRNAIQIGLKAINTEMGPRIVPQGTTYPLPYADIFLKVEPEFTIITKESIVDFWYEESINDEIRKWYIESTSNITIAGPEDVPKPNKGKGGLHLV